MLDVDNGEAMDVWREGCIWEDSILPLNFAVNLKLRFKISI